jgi:hypothetical protein
MTEEASKISAYPMYSHNGNTADNTSNTIIDDDDKFEKYSAMIYDWRSNAQLEHCIYVSKGIPLFTEDECKHIIAMSESYAESIAASGMLTF